MFTFLNDAWNSGGAPAQNASSAQMEAAGFELQDLGGRPPTQPQQKPQQQQPLSQYHMPPNQNAAPREMRAAHAPASEQHHRARLQQPPNQQNSPEHLRRVVATLQQRLGQFQEHYNKERQAVMAGKKCLACAHDPQKSTDLGWKIALGVLLSFFVVIVVVLIVICNKVYRQPPVRAVPLTLRR